MNRVEEVIDNKESIRGERDLTSIEIERRFRWNSRVASRSLEETAFILFQSTMVSLNEVGTVVWERFKFGASMGDVVTSVVEEFDVGVSEAEQDVGTFVEMLVKRELLQEDCPST